MTERANRLACIAAAVRAVRPELRAIDAYRAAFALLDQEELV